MQRGDRGGGRANGSEGGSVGNGRGREQSATNNNARLGASSAPPKLSWAVPCDCTGMDRTSRALARARIPKRYEHCDFENFDTDLWETEPEARAGTRAWQRPGSWSRHLPAIIRRAAKPESC